MAVRFVALPVAIIAILTAAERDAEACACCDGNTVVSALAWKDDGSSVLLRTAQFAACESQRFLSVVAEDKTKESTCYDLYGDPKKAVSCSRLKSNYGAKEKQPVVPAGYSRTATLLDPRLVRVQSRARRKNDPNDRTIAVDVWHRGGWVRVFTGHGNKAIHGEADDSRTAPHVVSIYPSPKRGKALLSISGLHVQAGAGHFTNEIAWITLPTGIETKSVKTDSVKSALKQSVPVYEKATDGDARREARRLNSLGLKRHRKAKYVRAAADFIYALESDPANVMARYNYACALSRLGFVDRAISQLEEIRDAKCGAKCDARLDRAEADEDLEAVRADPRFATLRASP